MTKRPGYLFLATALASLPLFVKASYAAPTPTPKPTLDSASASADIDPETIKANIKKRIEQAIQNQAGPNQKTIAYAGTLLSVTTNSFSLETLEGIKQASTSAATTFISLPSNKEIKKDDVSINDYLAAIGYVDDTTKVLDARRIQVLKLPPAAPTYKSFYGRLTHIDAKKSRITVVNPKSADEKVFRLTTKSKLFVTDPVLGKTKIEEKDVTENAMTMVVYEPAQSKNDDNVGTTMLIKANVQTTTVPPSPSPTPKVKASPTPNVKPGSTPKPTPSQ